MPGEERRGCRAFSAPSRAPITWAAGVGRGQALASWPGGGSWSSQITIPDSGRVTAAPWEIPVGAALIDQATPGPRAPE